MAIQISISNAIGSRYRGSVVPPIDPDAQAFITAASITDPTQQSAINQLVVDLKGYNIWTKMKALYPMVGGTSNSTSYNLKNPSQFQISWNGGVTWGANGVQFGGVNGYGNTFLTPSSSLTLNSSHISFYSRTDFNGGWDLACQDDQVITNKTLYLGCRIGGNFVGSIQSADANRVITANTDSRGLHSVSRSSSTSLKSYKNGALQTTNTTTSVNNQSTISVLLGAFHYKDGVGSISVSGYSSKQCAFASIGDGLTDTEAANLYTAVQTFQVTLGRSIGTQTVSDADAQAFVTNAGIVDQVEANAVNNLVIGLKADSLWAKMKALYPMVGGSSSTMKFNLKNPLDTDAAFRLVFNGGWTFSSNGATPNGTNAYADTCFIPSTHLTTSSAHFSKYNRTNDLVGNKTDGSYSINSGTTYYFQQNYSLANGVIGDVNSVITYTQTDTRGLFTTTRTASNNFKVFKNSSSFASNTNTITQIPTTRIYIGARNANSTWADLYNTYGCAFASIGDGLTDTEVANLNTRVTTFQTALNRNV